MVGLDTPQGRLAGCPLRALAREYPDDCRLPFHRHDRAQLLHAVSGVMEAATHEKLWLIPPGRALWMPAGVDHRMRAYGAVSLRTIYIHPASRPCGSPVIPTAVNVSPLLRELILRAIQMPPDYREEGREGRIMAMILDELDWNTSGVFALPMAKDRRIAGICAAFLDDPSDTRPLEAWSANVGASTRTLARLFQTEFGMSFSHWRQLARTVIALPRLSNGEPVARIAFDLGYETPGAFAAMFQRMTGERPSRYFPK